MSSMLMVLIYRQIHSSPPQRTGEGQATFPHFEKSFSEIETFFSRLFAIEFKFTHGGVLTGFHKCTCCVATTQAG